MLLRRFRVIGQGLRQFTCAIVRRRASHQRSIIRGIVGEDRFIIRDGVVPLLGHPSQLGPANSRTFLLRIELQSRLEIGERLLILVERGTSVPTLHSRTGIIGEQFDDLRVIVHGLLKIAFHERHGRAARVTAGSRGSN
jgi:hypothetical protein